MQQEVEGFGAQPGKEVTGGRGESNYMTQTFSSISSQQKEKFTCPMRNGPHICFFSAHFPAVFQTEINSRRGSVSPMSPQGLSPAGGGSQEDRLQGPARTGPLHLTEPESWGYLTGEGTLSCPHSRLWARI